MPTFQRLPRFDADWKTLPPERRDQFRRSVRHFVEDLVARRPFRKGLRIKRLHLTDDVFEMTFAPDGRATWHYGTEIRPGEPHVVWRRVGTHDILRNP